MSSILWISLSSGIQAQTDNSSKESEKTEKSSKIVQKEVLPSTDTRRTKQGNDIANTIHTSDTNRISDIKDTSDTNHIMQDPVIPIFNIRIANQIFLEHKGFTFTLEGKDAIIEDQNSQLIRKQLDLNLLEEANKYKDSLLISNQLLSKTQEKYYNQQIREIKKKSWIPWSVAFVATLLLGISL